MLVTHERTQCCIAQVLSVKECSTVMIVPVPRTSILVICSMLDIPGTLQSYKPKALPRAREWERRFHRADKVLSDRITTGFPAIFVMDRTMILEGYQNEGDPFSLLVRSPTPPGPTFKQPSVATYLRCPGAEIDPPFPTAFVCSTYTSDLSSVIRTPDVDRHIFPQAHAHNKETNPPPCYHTNIPLLTPVRQDSEGGGYLNDSNPRHIQLRPSFVAEFRSAAAKIGRNILWPEPIPLVISYLLRSIQHVYDAAPGEASAKVALLQQLIQCLPVMTRGPPRSLSTTSHAKVVWDIFSGTGSVATVFKSRHWDVYSLEINERFCRGLPTQSGPGTYVADIHSFGFTQWPRPDVIMVSPPCTQYTVCKKDGARDLPLADALVRRLIHIFRQHGTSAIRIVENPESSILWFRFQEALGLPFHATAAYCQYGFPYQKRTRFASTIPLRLQDCSHGKYYKHPTSLGPEFCARYSPWRQKQIIYRIPFRLVHRILDQILEALAARVRSSTSPQTAQRLHRSSNLGGSGRRYDPRPSILSISSELQGVKWLKSHDKNYMADIKQIPPPEYTSKRAQAVIAAVRIGPILDEKIKMSLLETITKHQEIFSLEGEGVRAVNPGGGVGTINTGIHPPISQKAMRQMSPTMKRAMDFHVAQLLRHGVLQPSQSNRCAHPLLVKKAKFDPANPKCHKDLRFVVDFRMLNSIMKTPSVSKLIPKVSECLAAFQASQVYSCVDMRSSYHQIPLAPESREKTAFATSSGL